MAKNLLPSDIPVSVNDAVPSGEVWLVTGGEVVGRIYNIGDAIEPTSIEKITPAEKFGNDMPSCKIDTEEVPMRATPLMRRLGFHAHPLTCTHYRKRMYAGSTRFHCADCGELL